jgi:hypothetical protein
MSNPNPPADPAPAWRWVRWIGLFALLGYAAFLQHNLAVAAGGSDSSGYLNSARLLAAGQFHTPVRAPAEFGPPGTVDPMHFLPQGFFSFGNRAEYGPTYPTGLPLHLALAGRLAGWHLGPILVVLGAALAAVALMYAVARELGLAPPLAAAGAVMLASCPVFLFTSIQPLSDTLATTWMLAALWTSLRARQSVRWAAVAGACFAMAVLVRPTNAVLAPALLVLLGAHLPRLSWFIVGGIPGAVWLAAYNHFVYGHALQSGYGNIGESFGWKFGGPTALHFVKWLALFLPAVVLALPFAAWFFRPRRELLALTLAFAAITGLYLFYEVSHEVWWCLRFILPAISALILTALLGVESLAERLAVPTAARFRGGCAALLMLWAAACAWYWPPRLDVYMIKHYEGAYETGALAARAQLPPDALVTSFAFSGSLYFYTSFAILRWDQVDAAAFQRYATRARQAGRPVCAVLFDWEEKDAFTRCPGNWTRLSTIRNVGLWQLNAPSS